MVIQFRQEWIGDIDKMQREMSRLLDHIAGTKPPMARFSPTVWEPAIDLYENDDELVVTVELAGVKEIDFQIMVDRNTLTIRGERRMVLPSSRAGANHRMEIARGPFERSLVLHASIDAASARASYEDGLVQITLPKVKKRRAVIVGIKVR